MKKLILAAIAATYLFSSAAFAVNYVGYSCVGCSTDKDVTKPHAIAFKNNHVVKAKADATTGTFTPSFLAPAELSIKISFSVVDAADVNNLNITDPECKVVTNGKDVVITAEKNKGNCSITLPSHGQHLYEFKFNKAD